jgi:hypothetical protein
MSIFLAMLLVQPDALHSGFHTAKRAWVDCTRSVVSSYLPSHEPADAIATEALRACGSEERDLKAVLIAKHGSVKTDRGMVGLRTRHRQKIIAEILQQRTVK